jgi:uncharacterized membrane-anchored protein YitT (DUF2179 family)
MLHAKKCIIIIIGSSCLALGIHLFLMPHLILDGGIIGIALMMNYLFGIRVGSIILLFSLPFFFMIWHSHRLLVMDSLLGLLISTILIDLLAPLQYLFIYYVSISALWSSLIGGLIMGFGFGLMLRYKTSTGGIDLFAHLLATKYKWNSGLVMFMIDVIIIGCGGLLISLDTLVYSMVTVASGGIVTGWMTKSLHPL